MQILRGPEVEREDGPRGIVDGAEQAQGRGAEPIEHAPVDEDEGPAGGPPGAAGAVLRGAATALGGQAEAPTKPTDGTATDAQALDLAQLLGGVAVIEVGA